MDADFCVLQAAVTLNITPGEKALSLEEFLRQHKDELLRCKGIESVWCLWDTEGKNDAPFEPTMTVEDLLAHSPGGAYLCQDEDDLPHAREPRTSLSVASTRLLLSMFLTDSVVCCDALLIDSLDCLVQREHISVTLTSSDC
jgi:hypothetical protein